MDRQLHEDDGRMYGVSSLVERRKLNWSAIIAGVVATLGLQVLMMYIGAALGFSVLDPYAPPSGNNASFAWPVLYLAVTALASSFFGAWVTGHWANLYESEDAIMHGALTWALGAVVIAAGLGATMQMGVSTGAQAAQAAALLDNDAQPAKDLLNYSSLDDQRFTDYVMNRARAWEKANPATSHEEAVNVSAENSDVRKRSEVKPSDIKANDELKNFLTGSAELSDDQADKFLDSEKENIAKAQEDSHKRWEQAHARELAQAEKSRKAASTAAWTWTGLALLALGASIGGSYLGWRQRYHEEEEVVIEETGPSAPL